MLSASNQRNLKRLIRFLSREDENGYIFAYADKTAQIKGINQKLQQHFEQNKQKIGIFFYNKHQNVTLIEQLTIFNREQKYQGIIVANLYEHISDTKFAQRNLTEINFAREQFHALNTPIIFWITQEIYPQLINNATDLYTQRRLPSIVFESEQKAPKPLTEIKTPQEQTAKTSTQLKIAQQQFEKALSLKLSKRELVNDYLIHYLLELSKHHQKQKVHEIYRKYQNTIKPFVEKNSQQLGTIFDTIHNYSKALEFYSIYIKAQNAKHQQLALTLITRCDVYQTTGEFKNALKDAEYAKEIMLELCLQLPKNKDYSYTLGMAQSRLGDLHKSHGNLSQALEYFEDNLKLTKELFDDNPNNANFKNSLAVSYKRLGDIHKDLGNLDQGLKFFNNALKTSKELYKDYPNHIIIKNGLAISYERLGDVYTDLGNLVKALEFFDEETMLLKELFKDNPNNQDFKNGLAISYKRLGVTNQHLGNLNRALQYFYAALELTKELLNDNPNNVKFKQGLAISYDTLGNINIEIGNLSEALHYLKDGLNLTKELYKDYPYVTSIKSSLAFEYLILGKAYQKLNKEDSSIFLNYFQKGKKLFEELSNLYPEHIEFKKNRDKVNEILQKLK